MPSPLPPMPPLRTFAGRITAPATNPLGNTRWQIPNVPPSFPPTLPSMGSFTMDTVPAIATPQSWRSAATPPSTWQQSTFPPFHPTPKLPPLDLPNLDSLFPNGSVKHELCALTHAGVQKQLHRLQAAATLPPTHGPLSLQDLALKSYLTGGFSAITWKTTQPPYFSATRSPSTESYLTLPQQRTVFFPMPSQDYSVTRKAPSAYDQLQGTIPTNPFLASDPLFSARAKGNDALRQMAMKKIQPSKTYMSPLEEKTWRSYFTTTFPSAQNPQALAPLLEQMQHLDRMTPAARRVLFNQFAEAQAPRPFTTKALPSWNELIARRPTKSTQGPVWHDYKVTAFAKKLSWAISHMGMTDSDLSFEQREQIAQLTRPSSRLLCLPGKDDLGLSFINGMNTSQTEFMSHTHYTHQFASEYQLFGVYNHSNWVGIDTLECLFNFAGYSPNTKELLHLQWFDFFAKHANPSDKFLQFCHSQGAIHTYNALIDLPQQLRDRIIVVAIAPARVIPDALCYKSFNYAIENDIVPQLRPLISSMGEIASDEISEGYRIVLQEQSELIMLEQRDSGMGHSYQSESYKETIQQHIKEHIQRNGRYP